MVRLFLIFTSSIYINYSIYFIYLERLVRVYNQNEQTSEMTTKILMAGVLAMALGACSPESVDTTGAQTKEVLAEKDAQELTGNIKVTEPSDSVVQAPANSSEKPLFESPGFKNGGTIVPGHYACQDMPGMQLKSLSEMGSFQRSTTHWTSEFDIAADGEYTYRGSEPQPGKYSYNPTTGTITWTTGPYSSDPGEEDTITGVFTTRRSDESPVIFLVFRSPAYGESCVYCALVPKK
jgi:hypothetical protein